MPLGPGWSIPPISAEAVFPVTPVKPRLATPEATVVHRSPLTCPETHISQERLIPPTFLSLAALTRLQIKARQRDARMRLSRNSIPRELLSNTRPTWVGATAMADRGSRWIQTEMPTSTGLLTPRTSPSPAALFKAPTTLRPRLVQTALSRK